jgi:hypothetical protein
MKLGSVKLPATSTFDILSRSLCYTFLHRFLHSYFGVSLHGFYGYFFTILLGLKTMGPYFQVQQWQSAPTNSTRVSTAFINFDQSVIHLVES